MSQYALTDTIKTFGEWWTPENPTRRVGGNLTYEDARIRLSLVDAFIKLTGTVSRQTAKRDYAVVHGVTRESEAVSLLNVMRSHIGLTFSSGGMRQPETLLAPILINGKHVSAAETYKSAIFRVPGLQIWLARPVFALDLHGDRRPEGVAHQMNILSTVRETYRVDKIGAEIGFFVATSANTDDFVSASLLSQGMIRVEPNEPRDIRWYLGTIGTVTELLSFISGATMSSDRIQLYSSDDNPRPLSVIVSSQDRKYCPYKGLHEFYLNRSALGDGFGAILTRWFEIYEKIESPSRLALSTMSSEKLWLHIEFLSLLQSLEGIHRAMCSGLYMDAVEYESVKHALGSAIPASLSSGHKEALKSRIRYGNEISLAKRLGELADMFPDPVRKQLFRESGQVPRVWVDTRNYYTHWDEALRESVLSDEHTYHANVRLRHFLRLLFMHFAGVPEDALLLALSSENDEARFLRDLNSM